MAGKKGGFGKSGGGKSGGMKGGLVQSPMGKGMAPKKVK